MDDPTLAELDAIQRGHVLTALAQQAGILEMEVARRPYDREIREDLARVCRLISLLCTALAR